MGETCYIVFFPFIQTCSLLPIAPTRKLTRNMALAGVLSLLLLLFLTYHNHENVFRIISEKHLLFLSFETFRKRRSSFCDAKRCKSLTSKEGKGVEATHKRSWREDVCRNSDFPKVRRLYVFSTLSQDLFRISALPLDCKWSTLRALWTLLLKNRKRGKCEWRAEGFRHAFEGSKGYKRYILVLNQSLLDFQNCEQRMS